MMARIFVLMSCITAVLQFIAIVKKDRMLMQGLSICGSE